MAASSYYVTTTGSDTNSGTQANPFKTIQKGVDTASAGDTVFVGDGTYTENIVINKSGVEGNPITLTSVSSNSSSVIVNGGTGYALRDNGSNTHDWIIKGITFKTTGSSSFALALTSANWGGSVTYNWLVTGNTMLGGGIMVRGHNNRIENNIVDGQRLTKSVGDYATGLYETFGGGTASAYSTYTHHNTYKNNTIHGFSRSGLWTQGYTHDDVIENNTVYDIYGTGNSGQCIDLDGAGSVEWRHIVRNNNISGCGSESIQLENVFDSLLENNNIHDTLRGITLINYDASVGCEVGGENNQYGDNNGDKSCIEAATNNIIRQNIITNASGGAFVNYSMDGVHYLNNSVYGGSADMSFTSTQYLKSTDVINSIINSFLPSQLRTNSNNITSVSSAGYNNPPSDLSLKAGSVAIDKGINPNSYTNSVFTNLTLDFSGNPRLAGSAYDIGAYEYQNGQTTPITPTTEMSPTITPTETPSTGLGKIYYVSTTGNDAGDGITVPWKTIQKAASTLIAGDTVYIHSGTYQPAARIIPKNSGSVTKGYITYAAYPGEMATIDGTKTASAVSSGLFSIEASGGKSYLKIQNLNLINAKYFGIFANGADHIVIDNNQTNQTASSGIKIYGSNNILISNNKVRHACGNGDQENISVEGGSYVEVKNNEISLNDGKEGIDIKAGCNHCSVHHNYVHDFTGVSIYIDAYESYQQDISVYNNLISCNAGGMGIALSAEHSEGTLDGINVYNNVVKNCTGESGGIRVTNWITSTGVCGIKKNIVIANNTVVGNRGPGIIVQGDSSAQNVLVANNIVSQNSMGQITIGSPASGQTTVTNNLINGSTGTSGVNSISGDPQFVDLANGDFHLKSGSLAIDSGTAVPVAGFDYNDISRPQGARFDIGAFEYKQSDSLTPISNPGDANGDNKVDNADYLIWLNNFHSTNPSLGVKGGDFNLDGSVNGQDYVIWLNHYTG